MPCDISQRMQEEPLPPTPEPASQASVVEDVQPWNVLERRTLEDDSVMGCILPILRRAASIKHPDTLECLSVARLFSKCGLAGVAIDGQKCSRCAEGGRLCISPVISRKSANVECFSAMSRCTNCVLIDGNLKPGLDRRTLYCDIPSRTIWFDCFCNWWMPAEDRKLIRDSESATREYLDYYSFPTRYRKGTRNSVERKLGVLQSLANSRKIDRVMSAQPFPAVVGLLTNPVAVRDAFKNFWDQLPEDTWAYPTEEDGVPPPCLCGPDAATSSFPPWWQALKDLAAKPLLSSSGHPLTDIETAAKVVSVLPWMSPDVIRVLGQPSEEQSQLQEQKVPPSIAQRRLESDPHPGTQDSLLLQENTLEKEDDTPTLSEAVGKLTIGSRNLTIDTEHGPLGFDANNATYMSEENRRKRNRQLDGCNEPSQGTEIVYNSDSTTTSIGVAGELLTIMGSGQSDESLVAPAAPETLLQKLPLNLTEEFWGIDAPTECRGARVIGRYL